MEMAAKVAVMEVMVVVVTEEVTVENKEGDTVAEAVVMEVTEEVVATVEEVAEVVDSVEEEAAVP